MSEIVYRISEESESTLRPKSGLSDHDFSTVFRRLEQKGLVKKEQDGRLAAAPAGLRYQTLSLDDYRVMYAILDLQMLDTEHPLIVVSPDIQGGRPHLAGTRITVENVSIQYEAGEGPDQIIEDYPHLSRFDVDAALRFYFAKMYPASVR